MKSLQMKWIWIVALVVGLGCGDDDSSVENNVNSKLTTSNNTTHAETNNAGSTNQGPDNTANPQNTNNQNSASTNNASTNNTSTNNTSTNNETNTQPTGISCMEILQCLLVCTAGDEECQDACSAQGTEDAQMEIDAFLGCVDTHCAEAMTVTTLTECTLENCSEEQNTCLGM